MYDHKQNGEWSIHFNGQLRFLQGFWTKTPIIGTGEEVIKQIDEFLVRMSKLTLFL
jgi:hypothetical protein